MAKPLPKLWIFLGIAALALAVRLPHLGERPMHTDEAVNSYLTGQLLAGQKYQYDPRDRHGPALYAFSYPIARAAGAGNYAQLSESALRLGPVLIGAVMVFLFAAAVKQGGLVTAIVAAFLFAVGPLPVYYSRYFIHETLFVAATLGLIISGARLLATRFVEPGVASGFYAGIMLACKETAFLHFAALGIAGVAGFFMFRRSWRESAPSEFVRPLTLGPGLTGALVAFVAVVVMADPWCGTHWKGLTDLFHSVPHLAARAGGQGHEKPAQDDFTLLSGGKSGAVVLTLALLGGLAVPVRIKRKRTRVIPDAQYPPPPPRAMEAPALTLPQSPSTVEHEEGKPGSREGKRTDSDDPARSQSDVFREEAKEKGYEKESEGASEERKTFGLLLIYTIAIAGIYSLIPYKTPWLALNLWLPLTLLAGFACAIVWRNCKSPALRVPLVLGAGAIIAALGFDTWQRAFDKPADEQNPYAYAHTSEDLLRLPKRLAALAQQSQSRSGFRITVVADDPWPLPWYLRTFPQTGYWLPGQREPGPAEVYITSTEAEGRLGTRLKNWRPEFFGLRPGVLIVLWTPPEKESTP